jgi:hypothetical protein
MDMRGGAPISDRERTPGGAVIAAKYGKHADDQWSVDELLSYARG